MTTDFHGLEQYDRFILWDLELNPEKGDLVKRPLDWKTGALCDATDARYHTSAEMAVTAARERGKEVGFVICAKDPFFFIDIDDGLDSDGKWRPDCQEVMDMFPGAFRELSQSGTGMHIIGSCDKTKLISGRRCKAFKFDKSFDSLFTDKRFVALTMAEAEGEATLGYTVQINRFIQGRLIDGQTEGGSIEWTTEPLEGEGLSDADVIEKALRSESTAGAFGHSVRFVDLWQVNSDELGKHFPDDHGTREYDASKADASMAQHLAFWTAGNCEQMMRIMRMSDLNRGKWDARDDYYLPRTVRNAVNRQKTFYTGRTLPPPPPETTVESVPPPPPLDVEPVPLKAELLEGPRYLTAQEQVKHFDGCAYVVSIHRVLTKKGFLLKPETFRAAYGGYQFEMDSQGKAVDNAFKVFTESKLVAFPQADDVCFNPSLPSHTVVDGKVNTYIPEDMEVVKGDVTPFLDHMSKLVPDDGDRDVLLDYMAACVQRPGDKFQWCPMIQGTEGNGKSLIGTVLRNAIGRRYYHQQDPEDLGSVFNQWLENSIIVCVEEIFVNSRHEMSNRMKAMITNDYTPIQSKGVDQRSAENCAKFILFSNHKDGVYKHKNDRRYAVFYTAQQEKGDKTRDGLTGEYFHRLYGWVNSRDGKAALNWFLLNREVSTSMMGEAPLTTSTEEAVYESLGGAERALLEAIEAKEIGLRGGILASPYVDDVLAAAGHRKTNPKWRGKVLANIGYKLVKDAPQGRLRIDGRRMTIYVDQTSLLTSVPAGEIKQLYKRYNGVAS